MTTTHRRRAWGAGAGLAAALAAGVAAQQVLRRRIAADPHNGVLRVPASGTPRKVRSADGTELHVEHFGSPEGVTIVLLHGWTEAIGYWTPVIRELEARGFRVVALDLRGHGSSGRAADGDYSLARFGEDLEAVLEDSVPDGQRAVVVGHSLGAMSIAAWAEHHDVPRLVAAAALLNTGVGDLIAESLLIPLPKIAHALNQTIALHGFLGSRAPLPRFSTPLSHAAIRYAAFGPEATPAQVAFYERMLVSTPPDVRADVGIAMSEMSLLHALERLTIPTLVVAGEKDRLTPPSHARRIADMVPSLHKLVILDQTGHMGPLERPQEISEELADLAGVRSRAPSVSLR
jgi:pimeloyl-ACP methyl ester carboxylesterase